jgi:DNA-binding MarR family transcriptional regulator
VSRVTATVGDITITIEAEGGVWDTPDTPGVKYLIDALAGACYAVEHSGGIRRRPLPEQARAEFELTPEQSAALERSATEDAARREEATRGANEVMQSIVNNIVTGAYLDTEDGPEEIVPGPDDEMPSPAYLTAGPVDHMVDKMLAVLVEEDLSLDGPNSQAVTRQLADKLNVRPQETREPIAVAREKEWVKTVHNDRRRLQYLGITRAGEQHLKAVRKDVRT